MHVNGTVLFFKDQQRNKFKTATRELDEGGFFLSQKIPKNGILNCNDYLLNSFS